MDDEVRDVAMDEHLARREIHDLVRGHAAVGAADPQISGRLLIDQPREEVRLRLDLRLGPGPVLLQQVFEAPHSHAS